MILIPQRLFVDNEVKTIFRNGNTCILEKKLSQSLYEREGYISNHVISILLTGQQHIRTYEEKRITIKSGEVLFIPRGLYHITDLIPEKGHFHSLLFYFGDEIVQEFLSEVQVAEIERKQIPEFLRLGIVPNVSLFAESLIQIYQTKKHTGESILKLKILELMHLLNDLVSEKKFIEFLFQVTLPKRRNIKTFIENNFDKPLTIEDYAYLTGRSVSTFRRDFKEQFGVMPKKWLKEKRIEKSLNILNRQEISVTQLAYDVGYENISYFIKEFKTEIGITPKQYMLSLHRNNLLP
jgi:AraC-like DNA-binding protein